MKKINLEDNLATEPDGASQAPEGSQPKDDKTAALEAQITELTSDLQRTRADFENFRKQVELQKSQIAAVTKQSTVLRFLPLIDDFERALSTYPDELAPLEKSFTKTLATLNLERINSGENVEFNPDFHEAVSVNDDEGDVEVIAETLRPGYLYEGNVIRPAMVKVKHLPLQAS